MRLELLILDYLDARPLGAELRQIRADLADSRVGNCLGVARRAGLVECREGRWHRTDRQRPQSLVREHSELDVSADCAAADRRFAALIGNKRYEDARVRPLPLRAMRAEPNATLIGCAANMCAY